MRRGDNIVPGQVVVIEGRLSPTRGRQGSQSAAPTQNTTTSPGAAGLPAALHMSQPAAAFLDSSSSPSCRPPPPRAASSAYLTSPPEDHDASSLHHRGHGAPAGASRVDAEASPAPMVRYLPSGHLVVQLEEARELVVPGGEVRVGGPF